MHVTKITRIPDDGNFDWTSFFSAGSDAKLLEAVDPRELVQDLRATLKENDFKFTLAIGRMLRSLLRDLHLHDVRVLELGAATGFLSRWLVSELGGGGVLVDNNDAAFNAFMRLPEASRSPFEYLLHDVFTLELAERFDIVCSFGLAEHFADKTGILRAHERFVKPGGLLVILVPLDSPLTRVFYAVHPELNLGYRELWSAQDCKSILTDYGLEVVGMATSIGYTYDAVAAACRSRL